jgi:flagellar M-ring protein FliF
MNFIANLRALPVARQIMLAVAVLGVVGIMSFMVQGAMKQPMGLLYSGLDASVTGEIIDELDKRGTRYEIKGDAILVPQKDRDSVRFALARDGLPKQSVQGYELLDNVNGFSVTSEMYNAAYWRAKEGELTRTILAVPGIQSARVHIGASLRSGFARSDPAQTASVTLSSAHNLTSSQAQGIQYLVALAVSGLSPDEVAVIDLNKGILAGPGVASAERSGVADRNRGIAAGAENPAPT